MHWITKDINLGSLNIKEIINQQSFLELAPHKCYGIAEIPIKILCIKKS